MRALVLFYNGGEPTTNCKAAIATSVAVDTGANKGEMVMKILNENELTNLVVSTTISNVNEKPAIDETVSKSICLLKKELTEGSDDQQSVLVRLLIATRTRNDKEAVENAIKVLGMYEYPHQLRAKYGLSTGIINACKTLCNILK